MAMVYKHCSMSLTLMCFLKKVMSEFLLGTIDFLAIWLLAIYQNANNCALERMQPDDKQNRRIMDLVLQS